MSPHSWLNPNPQIIKGNIILTRRGSGQRISRRVDDIVGIDCNGPQIGCTVHFISGILSSESLAEEVVESMDSILTALPSGGI